MTTSCSWCCHYVITISTYILQDFLEIYYLLFSHNILLCCPVMTCKTVIEVSATSNTPWFSVLVRCLEHVRCLEYVWWSAVLFSLCSKLRLQSFVSSLDRCVDRSQLVGDTHQSSLAGAQLNFVDRRAAQLRWQAHRSTSLTGAPLKINYLTGTRSREGRSLIW